MAVHLARKRGEDVPPALLAIQEAGADAARELRATLGVLRSEEDGDGSGLGQLGSLVARARAAGLPVTMTVTGAERPLPPEVDQAAYRIVQESLTNTRKHAGPVASASVVLRYSADALVLTISDDGRGFSPSRTNGGSGMTGMRDRLAAVGGELWVDSAPGTGTRVRGRVPLDR